MIICYAAWSPEIDQLDRIFGFRPKENVVWLYITVHVALTVEISNSRKQLSDDFSSRLLVKTFKLLDPIEERSTKHKFVDEIELFLVFKHLDDLADIGVIKLAK